MDDTLILSMNLRDAFNELSDIDNVLNYVCLPVCLSVCMCVCVCVYCVLEIKHTLRTQSSPLIYSGGVEFISALSLTIFNPTPHGTCRVSFCRLPFPTSSVTGIFKHSKSATKDKNIGE